MKSITELDLQYAHRFYGFKGEAQFLHGHTGILTIEVEDSINPGVNMVFPCNEIKKTAWEVLQNFDHALILREDDPLLPAILDVYEKQGIRNGAPTNTMKGPSFKTELATAYPECRLVVTKETMTVEGFIKIVYDLLKVELLSRKKCFYITLVIVIIKTFFYFLRNYILPPSCIISFLGFEFCNTLFREFHSLSPFQNFFIRFVLTT